VHEAELHLAEAAAAELRLQVRRPQALSLHLFLHGIGDAPEGVEVEVEGLERDDLLAHEVPHPFELRFELRLGREVPCHESIPLRLILKSARPP
jgi:hypothetical protein